MSKNLFFLFIFLALTFSGVEAAYLDTAQITATASSEYPYSPGGVPSSTIDKSGLDVGTLLLHNSDYHNNWHINPGVPGPVWIKYEFNQAYELGAMWIWNMNQAGLGVRGIKDVTIEHSMDGVNWASIGQYQFAKAPGADGYAHNSEINFYGLNARYIRINAINSWGDAYWGLAEVRFNLHNVQLAKAPNPFPGTNTASNSLLSWTAGQGALSHNVYFGTNAQDVNNATTSTPGIYKGNQTSVSYNPGTMQNGTTYYWRIDEVTSSQTYKGVVWSFNVVSASAYNPVPADNAQNVDVTELTWTPGEGAVSHNVYVGQNYNSVLTATTSTSGIFKGNQSSTSYSISLDLGKTYYWRIDEVKTGGAVIVGDVWSFTTEPDNIISSSNIIATASSDYGGVQPASKTVDLSGMSGDTHNNDWLSMWMTSNYDWAPWYIQYEFDQIYPLTEMWVWNYNHTITRGIKKCMIEYSTDGSSWTQLGGTGHYFQFAQATGSTTLPHGNEIDFGGVNAKYVRITTSDDSDATWGDSDYCGLSEVRFYIPSLYASTPSPADGSRYNEQSLTLSWSSGGLAESHNVYYGTNYNAVELATTASPEYKANRTVTNYPVTGLQVGQTYYWRVDEVDGSNTRKGNVWSFTVRPWSVATGITSPLYISTSGNDNNNGSINSPFASLVRAKYAVRALISAGLTSDVHVYLRSGTYYQDETLALDNMDSPGSTYKIYYEAFLGENPVISGGKQITGWTSIGSDKWQTTISDVQNGNWYFRQLWADGSRCQRARWPNAGTRFTVTGVSQDLKMVGINQTVQGSNLAGNETELVLYHSWTAARAKVSANNSNSVTTATVCGAVGLSLTQPTAGGTNPDGLTTIADLGFLENNPDYIDQPGEWYLNRNTGVLTYKAAPGVNPNNINFIAPKITHLLTIDGTKTNNLKNIIFKGISFQNAGWDMPQVGFGGSQGGYYCPTLSVSPQYIVPPAIVLTYASNCVFNNCYFANLGASCISLGAGCDDNQIINSKIYDVSGIGVIVGYRADKEGLLPGLTYTDWADVNDAPIGNDIINNQMISIDREWFGCVSILEHFAKQSEIRNNNISDLTYSAISSGWATNLSTPYSQQGVIISQNHIFNVVNTLSDGGGIYTLGDHRGGMISGNLIHDIAQGTYGLNGAVYTDGSGSNSSRNLTIQNSLTYNVSGNDSYRSNANQGVITLLNNYWDMPVGSWGSTQNAIAAAAGVVPAALTLTISFASDCGSIIVSGICEPWSQISTAKINGTNVDIKSLLTVKTNGAISGVIPASYLSSAPMTIQVVTIDPDGHLSAAGTSNSLSPVVGDMNCDRKVDFKDLKLMAANWLVDSSSNGTCPALPSGDISGDCKVNFKDFNIMAWHWLEQY
ncbi:MAG: discoidin domain-containing protein [Phycisphaerales bacterium]